MAKRAIKLHSLAYCNGYDDARNAPADRTNLDLAICGWACDYAAGVCGDIDNPIAFEEEHGSYCIGYRDGLEQWAADKEAAYDFIIAQWDRHTAAAK